jgi:hypothetical protein
MYWLLFLLKMISSSSELIITGDGLVFDGAMVVVSSDTYFLLSLSMKLEALAIELNNFSSSSTFSSSLF